MKKYQIFVYISSGLLLLLIYMFSLSVLNELFIYQNKKDFLFFKYLINIYNYIVIILFIINFVVLLTYKKIKNGLISTLITFYFAIISIMSLKPNLAFIVLLLSIFIFLFSVKIFSLDANVHKKLEKDPKIFKYISNKQANVLKILFIIYLISFIIFRLFSLHTVNLNNNGGTLTMFTGFTGLLGYMGLSYFSIILLGRSYDDKKNIQNKQETFLFILIVDILIVIFILILRFL